LGLVRDSPPNKVVRVALDWPKRPGAGGDSFTAMGDDGSLKAVYSHRSGSERVARREGVLAETALKDPDRFQSIPPLGNGRA